MLPSRRGRRSSTPGASPSPPDAALSPSGAALSPSSAAPSPSGAALSPSTGAIARLPVQPSSAAPSPSGAAAGPSTGAIAGPSTGPPVAVTRVHISPLGDSFTDPVRIVHDINRIVNNHWRGEYMNFRSTPNAVKEMWWSEFKRAFTWEPSDEAEICRIFRKKCGDHIRHTLHHAKSRNKKPAMITDENWVKISNAWKTDDIKKISDQNKLNQAYNTGASSATYAGGSINIDEHARRLAKELGRDPNVIDTFTRTFQKKDKSWSGDRAKAMKDKYCELELAQQSSAGSSEGSEPSVGNELSLWLEASGGCKGGGRILGMGSLSRTYKVAGTSSTTSPVVTSQIHSLTEEVTHLKGLLEQRDQEMIRRDEEMKKRDNEIKKLQRQQSRILQHFQLQSLLGDDDDDDDDHDDASDDGGFCKQIKKKRRIKDSDEESSRVSGGPR
ncbi:uncharacterized protein LOC141812114 [Curcuma longa]|uniref:uncharacterized protein LOC141812114 n=2 Tax=Curcuma longa TaxID=136217 RepID=UPI003D9DEA04